MPGETYHVADDAAGIGLELEASVTCSDLSRRAFPASSRRRSKTGSGHWCCRGQRTNYQGQVAPGIVSVTGLCSGDKVPILAAGGSASSQDARAACTVLTSNGPLPYCAQAKVPALSLPGPNHPPVGIYFSTL